MIHVSERLTATIEQLVAAERVRALYAAMKVAAVRPDRISSAIGAILASDRSSQDSDVGYRVGDHYLPIKPTALSPFSAEQ
jgi:hypothetical protein